MTIGTYISIITLNVNKLKAPTKRYRWIYKQDPYICCLQEAHFRPRDTFKKMTIGTYISIITLNVNRLNAPTKRHSLGEWIKKKQGPYTCCLQETHFRPEETYRLKVREWKNIFHANGKQKKSGVAIFI